MNTKEIARNKKAFFDYEVLETIEAGLVLSGQEVKSAKQGRANLKGSFVSSRGQILGISNMHISKYKPAGHLPDYDPDQWRELLLHKKQINRLLGKMTEKGLTIVPLKMYTKGRLIKIELGVCKGKKTYNKREILKKRDTDREIQRTLKNTLHS